MYNLIYLLFFLFSTFSYADIYPIKFINQARPNLEKADNETLVVLDFDRTLIKMGDQLLLAGKAGFLEKIKAFPAYLSLSQEEQDNLLSLVLLQTSHLIIENEALEIIENLQKKGIKTIACSTMVTGKFGSISNMEEWRLEILKDVNLSFKNAFPEIDEIIFSSGSNDRPPVYKDGLLSTAKQTKGEILRLFLEMLNWHPNKIIMIDDQFSALESVENELKQLNIEFQGFHYQYVEELLKEQIIDEKLVDYQINYLLNYGIWLTDEEALLVLN